MSGHISISALTRAVFDLSVYCLARVKRSTAVSACGCTALVANPRLGGSRRKFVPALSAYDCWRCLLKGAKPDEFWMLSPKFLLNNAVTWRAKRDEVFESVGKPVIVKQPKGLDVVDGQTGRGCSAPLTSIVVALSRRCPLCCPVRAAILGVSAAPCGVVFSGKRSRSGAPNIVAISGAKVMGRDLTWNLFEFCSALVASQLYARADLAFFVLGLPFGIASESAEMVFCHRCVIRLAENIFSALSTFHCDHNSIIPRLDRDRKGHFAWLTL